MSASADNQRFAAHIGVAADVFARPTVALELPIGRERDPESVNAFAMAANLLARLFTKLHLVNCGAPIERHPWHISTLKELVPFLGELSAGCVTADPSETVDIAIGIGEMPSINAKRKVLVSFDGWEVALDQKLASTHPGIFGALLAACYGSAQAFLHAVSLVGGDHTPMKPFRFSLLDYSDKGTNAPTPEHVDLGTVHLVGVGAVGSALVYSLAHVRSLTGLMHLIDNDAVDGSNLQRYILMRAMDVSLNKPDVAVAALAKSGIEAKPYPKSFRDFVNEVGGRIDLLLTPVDSEAGRRHLATHLPRRILNAATGSSTVTVSRHGFADDKACLHCLYMPVANEMTTERRLALDLGLQEEEVASLMVDNVPASAELVARIENHRHLSRGALATLVGKHIQSLYQQAVCSSAPVTTAAGTIVSPLSFISATAGVLLAAELTKQQSPSWSAFALDNYFRLDTLQMPNPSFRQLKQQEITRGCICWDEAYRTVYRRRYGNGAL